jgi:hypothetical protein
VKPIISVLISGLIERIDRILPLYYELLRQARGQKAEVLVLVDNRVAMPLEAKRNRLLAASKGRFVAFVDDDDWVAEDYVSAIIDMARQQPEADVICFQQSSSLGDGLPPFLVTPGLAYENEPCRQENGRWVDLRRKPWHWCAWKGELARTVAFECGPDEDWVWVQSLLPFCTREARIERVLHYYRFYRHSSAALNTDLDRAAGRSRFTIQPTAP